MKDNFDEFFDLAGELDFKPNSTFEERNVLCTKIFDFIVNVRNDYQEIFKALGDSNVRFIDYYDSMLDDGQTIVDSFCSSYSRKDVDVVSELFVLYVILKKSIDFVLNYDEFDNFDDFYDCLDMDNYFGTLSFLIDFMEEKKRQREESSSKELFFLKPENKYKILFTGHSCDDIKQLEPKTLKSLIGKLNSQFCCMDVIPLSEDIDHTKELYDFTLSRIRLGDSYRIAFTRRKDVTAILGVTKKTGRDIDYTRYDSVARNAIQIYRDIDLFSSRNLPSESSHFDTVRYLQDFNDKIEKTY